MSDNYWQESCPGCKPKSLRRGGIVRGGAILALIEPAECIVSRGGVCQRTDDAHRNADIPEPRWWTCPARDSR